MQVPLSDGACTLHRPLTPFSPCVPHWDQDQDLPEQDLLMRSEVQVGGEAWRNPDGP